MLVFKISDTTAELIMTLAESTTLTAPYFRFVFTHVTTGDQVTFVKGPADEESQYTSRYNLFTINPSEVFDGKPLGEYHYEVFEQEAGDSAETTSLVEVGKLDLRPETEYAPTEYEAPNTYIVYNG